VHYVRCYQGDKIGRIFASWAIFYGQFFNYQTEPKFFGYFFPKKKSYVLISIKNRFGHTLGDFFHKLIWSPSQSRTRQKTYFEIEKKLVLRCLPAWNPPSWQLDPLGGQFSVSSEERNDENVAKARGVGFDAVE
jgi:hypothetical protein